MRQTVYCQTEGEFWSELGAAEWRDQWADRQVYREINGQIGRYTERSMGREAGIQRDQWADRRVYRETDGWIGG